MKRYTIEHVRGDAASVHRSEPGGTVATNLYLVLSKRPEAISAQDYDRWYEAHAQENIESPGFLNARRFKITPQRGSEGPFEHLAVYEYEGTQEQWRSDLNGRIESGDIKLPEWFPQITFGAWDCEPVSGLLKPARLGS
jgi:hypothetical protein